MNGYWVGPTRPAARNLRRLIDYMQMINARDGGINGVKVTWEKCETEYNNARGVESTSAPRSGARQERRSCTAFHRHHYSLIDKGTSDHIPIVSIGYGRTDASDGRVFRGYSADHQLLEPEHRQNKVHRMKEGGMDKLKGKKIVNIYHDSAYARKRFPCSMRKRRNTASK